MEAFKSLQIYGSDRTNLLMFLDILKSQNNNEWRFLEKETTDYAIHTFKEIREVAVFASPVILNKKATVWLILSGREVRITNIVPVQASSLSYYEYNSIFDRFFDQKISPAAKIAKVDALSTAPEIHMEELVGNETYEKLTIWEITSNSDSGNGHPLDFERWADFLITAFTYKSNITPQLLKRWLLEDRGWSDIEVVEKLSDDFEYGMDLLNYYADNK